MRVVISFTTIPSRIRNIEQMVYSVLDQTYKADRIILWVPDICEKEGVGYNIDGNLAKFFYDNNIELIECSRDWGPATKLIPTLFLENDPETALITLDDDVVYERHAVGELVEASIRYPRESLGFMGGLPGPQFIHAEQLHLRSVNKIEVDGLGGYRGILYRRGMFDHTVVNELVELLKEGPCVVDDQVFGWNLSRRGIGRSVIRTEYPGYGGGLNFRFLNLGNGIYDTGNTELARESIKRLEDLYTRNGWKK